APGGPAAARAAGRNKRRRRRVSTSAAWIPLILMRRCGTGSRNRFMLIHDAVAVGEKKRAVPSVWLRFAPPAVNLAASPTLFSEDCHHDACPYLGPGAGRAVAGRLRPGQPQGREWGQSRQDRRQTDKRR